jgi:hypothetical protein
VATGFASVACTAAAGIWNIVQSASTSDGLDITSCVFDLVGSAGVTVFILMARCFCTDSAEEKAIGAYAAEALRAELHRREEEAREAGSTKAALANEKLVNHGRRVCDFWGRGTSFLFSLVGGIIDVAKSARAGGTPADIEQGILALGGSVGGAIASYILAGRLCCGGEKAAKAGGVSNQPLDAKV